MTRGVGGPEFAAGLSDPAAVGAALVTALGDVWFVFCLLGILYWFGPAMPGAVSLSRRAAAFGIALAVGGLAATTALKELFRLPRPSGAADPAGAALVPETLLGLYAEIGASGGFGFPSGHAVAAIVVYGGLALLVDSRRGYAVAAVLCVVVPLSRVALGVHYLVDILVGAALGAAYLAAVYRYCGRGTDPASAMAIAVVVAIGGVAVSNTADTWLALGGALGGLVGWLLFGGVIDETPATPAGGLLASTLGLALGGLFAASTLFDPSPIVEGFGMGLVVVGVFASPVVAEAASRRI
jgi:membrane-associated phospholipid phosphatase